MNRIVKARLNWLSPEIGGRKTLPTGPKYFTAARFEDEETSRPNVGWSVVVEFDKLPDESREMIATIRFLAQNDPRIPHFLLRSGGRFELFEGHRIVARGVILD
jgi:hypothetical protein